MNLKIIVNEKRKHKKLGMEGFPGGPVVKNPPPSARAMGSIPDLGRFHMPQGSRACARQLRKPVRPGASALPQEKPPLLEKRQTSHCS